MSEILYIQDIAKKLGKTEASIRGYVARGDNQAIPPFFKIGRKLAWSAEGVDKWMKEKQEQNQ